MMLSAGRTYCACARRDTATRAQDAYSAAYAYRYGDRLYQVTSNFPGESNSPVYDYGGDGKLRRRGSGTHIKYGLGFNPVNEFVDSMTQRFFVYEPHKAVSERLWYFSGGFFPTQYYYYHDHLGSARRLRNHNKASVAAYEYEPYGKSYPSGGGTLIFALHHYESGMRMHRAPYRNYSANMARWSTTDPLGMVDGPNMYGYVKGNPVSGVDIFGFRACGPKGWKTYVIPEGCPFMGTNFTPCCEKHDDCYSCDPCKNEGKSRWQCEKDFYKCMKKRCETDGDKWRYRYCMDCAFLYVTATTLGGSGHFRTDCPQNQ